MAELTMLDHACCEPKQQERCCEPSAKSACCEDGSTTCRCGAARPHGRSEGARSGNTKPGNANTPELPESSRRVQTDQQSSGHVYARRSDGQHDGLRRPRLDAPMPTVRSRARRMPQSRMGRSVNR